MAKRLFIAIPVYQDKQLLQVFSNLKNDLENCEIKWVDPIQFHITIYFIGNTIDEIQKELQIKLKALALNLKPFQIKYSKLGYFGNRKEPKVLWIGYEENTTFKGLVEDVKTIMRSFNFEVKRNNEIPHLTLGRIKKIDEYEQFNKTISGNANVIDIPNLMVDNFVLYESILSRKGAEYFCIEKYQLI